MPTIPFEYPGMRLKGKLYGQSPVQAEGTVAGRRFYFRARYDAWTFGVARDPKTDPVDIDEPSQGFFREGHFGEEYDASCMSTEDALSIIVDCARAFLEDEEQVLKLSERGLRLGMPRLS